MGPVRARTVMVLVLLASATAPAPAQLAPSAEERAEGFVPLFDGTTTAAWRGYWSDALPEGWHIVDGVLTKSAAIGDIVTRDVFSDFELRLDWKLARGGNAGIFYHGTEAYPKVYWSGPEYQLLDDANAPDGRNRLTAAGAAYGLYPAPEGIVHAAGEWNTTRIVVRRGHVEHWLNGTKLLEYQLWSAEWRAKVAASKFSAWPNYGLSGRGHIAIQGDHDGALSLRNIRILPR
jgi:hypothetical protein